MDAGTEAPQGCEARSALEVAGWRLPTDASRRRRLHLWSAEETSPDWEMPWCRRGAVVEYAGSVADVATDVVVT
jgi:hypothetical protein